MNSSALKFWGLGLLVGFTMTSIAQAQSQVNLSGSGLIGSAGFGVSQHDIISPKEDFTIDDGYFVNLQAERGLGFLGLALTFSLNHIRTQGRTNYEYETLSQTYTATDIAFNSEETQLGLGLKLRLFPGFFSPFVEGGGLFGYHQITYTETDQLSAQGSSYKTKDGLTEHGHYADAGIEVIFSQTFGVRASYRYMQMQTRDFDTLGGRNIKYNSSIIQIGFLKQF